MKIMAIVTAALLGAKILMVNDIHCSFAQDPLDQWTAIGVMILLVTKVVEK